MTLQLVLSLFSGGAAVGSLVVAWRWARWWRSRALEAERKVGALQEVIDDLTHGRRDAARERLALELARVRGAAKS